MNISALSVDRLGRVTGRLAGVGLVPEPPTSGLPSFTCPPNAMCAVPNWDALSSAGVPPGAMVPTDGPCVVGGIDANGNTIAGCPSPAPASLPCVSGQGPLQPGQVYCSDPFSLLSQQQAQPQQGQSMQGPYLVLGAVVLAFILIGGRR